MPSHSAGGQKSGTKVSAGPRSLGILRGASVLCLSDSSTVRTRVAPSLISASVVMWPPPFPCLLLCCLLQGSSLLGLEPMLILDALVLRSLPKLHLQRILFQIKWHSEVQGGQIFCKVATIQSITLAIQFKLNIWSFSSMSPCLITEKYLVY